MNVLGLIPARGGSKGVPGKNIRPLHGRSLIQRAYDSAHASGVLNRIVLSTDDPAIADAARGFGLEVPFLRPPELAGDRTPMIDVAVHAVETLARAGWTADVLVLLQPTSPFRTADLIRAGLAKLDGHDAVCTVFPLPKDLCPHYVMKVTDDGFLDYFLPEGRNYTRRQDVPQAYKRNGALFITRTSVLLGQRSFYGRTCVPLIMSEADSLNIDTPEEWAEAERRLKD